MDSVIRCKMCALSLRSLKAVISHYKAVHFAFVASRPLVCVHEACHRTFKSVQSWRNHMSLSHPRSTSTSAGPIRYKCSVNSCELATFQSPASLISHLRLRHLSAKQTVECPYSSCDYSTNIAANLKVHCRRRHFEDSIKPQLVLHDDGRFSPELSSSFFYEDAMASDSEGRRFS